jgi:pimeloyl-ACP methyl ester carboxylesterase
MTARALFRAAAVIALVALARLPAIAAPEVDVLDDGRRIVVVRPASAAPKGVMLLIPGGTTTLALGPGGDTKNGNFVIRTRALWLSAGYAIAYMNDPGDLRAAVALLRNVARPVIALSTSRGTIVAAQNAAKLGTDGPDLLVLTSPVTTGTAGPAELAHVPAHSLADVDLRPVKIPTLIVTNDGDTCKVSPPRGAAALAKRLGPNATLLHVASTESVGPPCEAFAPHGYYGIEDDVIAKIGAWLPVTIAP